MPFASHPILRGSILTLINVHNIQHKLVAQGLLLILFVIGTSLQPDQMDVFRHYADSFNDPIQLPLLDRLGKRVSHDSDQHIQKDDLNEECGQDEQYVACNTVWTFSERIKLEFPETQFILILEYI